MARFFALLLPIFLLFTKLCTVRICVSLFLYNHIDVNKRHIPSVAQLQKKKKQIYFYLPSHEGWGLSLRMHVTDSIVSTLVIAPYTTWDKLVAPRRAYDKSTSYYVGLFRIISRIILWIDLTMSVRPSNAWFSKIS